MLSSQILDWDYLAEKSGLLWKSVQIQVNINRNFCRRDLAFVYYFWQAVRIQMKCRIMRHFIRVNSVCQTECGHQKGKRFYFTCYDINHNVQPLSIYNGLFRVYRSQCLQNGSISFCVLLVWQAVEIQMKCRIMRHFIRVTSACKNKTKRPPEKSTLFCKP